MRKKYLLLSLVMHENMSKEVFGKNILSLFYNKYPTLAPQYANFHEPINKPIYNVQEALGYWSYDAVPIFLARRKSAVVGSWWVSEDFSKIGRLSINYNWNKDINWFELFIDLISVTRAYYGYVHVFTNKEIQPCMVGSSVFGFQNGIAGFHLKKGIPNLGWGTYFGEEYVKELDIPLLESHGFKVEKLGEGYTFNITDNLSDVIDNYDAFDERRKLLKSLFRPELFQKYEAYG